MTLLGKPVGSEPVTNERKRTSKQQMIWKIWIRQADRQSSNFALLVEEHRHRPGVQECRQGDVDPVDWSARSLRGQQVTSR
jgi:hypothetical protein